MVDERSVDRPSKQPGIDPLSCLFVRYLDQEQPFFKPAPLFGLLPPQDVQGLGGNAPCRGGSVNDLQQVGQLLRGFAFLIFPELLVELGVRPFQKLRLRQYAGLTAPPALRDDFGIRSRTSLS